jgi:WXG100 family type VII secretion target
LAIRVDPAELRQLASQFQSASDNVKATLGNLGPAHAADSRTEIGSDQAYRNYHDVLGQCTQAVSQIVTSLACIGQKLTVAADAYSRFQRDATTGLGS